MREIQELSFHVWTQKVEIIPVFQEHDVYIFNEKALMDREELKECKRSDFKEKKL